ncbi:MAG: hypothetical protein A2046_01535 [Bacteroidetes bacterium GWA2_30_7]|nr:MAG: hypothetical protein A2046_01535 [Bacteroidetes bacterium GWA2_30_7]
MKKTTLIISLLFVSLVFNAQPNKRVSAYNYLKYNELDKAKEAIDAACKHEATISDPKTWYYAGQIYQGIYVNKNFKSLDADALTKSLDAYKKAMALNFKDPANKNLDLSKEDDLVKFTLLLMNQKTAYVDDEIVMDIIMNRFPALANIFVNKGVTEFKDTKDYPSALNSFENSLFLSTLSGKLDTPIIYYAALAADKAKDFEKSIKYYDLVTKFGYGADVKEKASMFYLLAKVQQAKGDTVKYIETLKKGIDKYQEGSASLVTELINYYLETKQGAKALNYLKLAIEKDPSNATYHFAQGSLYDTYFQNVDSANISYKKAIELKSDYFDAYYNLGALYYNTGAAIIEKANDEKDLKKYDVLKKQADEKFALALPYLEKAYELNPEDISTMQSLKTLYYRTGNMEKHDQIKAKLTGK